MDNRGKRQAASIFGGMGFYIALLVCVIAAGVVGYFALVDRDSKNQDYTAVSQTDPGESAPVIGEEKEPAREVVSDQPVSVPYPVLDRPVIDYEDEPEAETPVSAPAPLEEEAESQPVSVPEKETTLVVAPLAGETVAVFSVEALTYDATLGDWRTHDGVDIQAVAGTEVVATSDGTVRSVFSDDAMGCTVVIDHPDGVVTTYSSLQPEMVVAPGDAVSAGTAIGTVGNTSLSEAALGAHLHFSVEKDGKTMDPAIYLG